MRKVEDSKQWNNKNYTPKELGTCMDKILVAEDNTKLSDSLCRNLQEKRFTAFVASSTRQARKYLDRGIDLCLLDLNLPDGNVVSMNISAKP